MPEPGVSLVCLRKNDGDEEMQTDAELQRKPTKIPSRMRLLEKKGCPIFSGMP
ncbi:hypothetical protein [Methylomicrobium agile]|uniref:hypothetical protein n=1 Tax=Methylomicrobium agile TaxID=39774 RepID=UPI000317E511|nr:hypothetical protein [Methylomicrobium agile]